MTRLLSLLFLAVSVNAARTTFRATPAAPANETAQVSELRTKLQAISTGLTKMLGAGGALATSHVADQMRTFHEELQRVLKDTEKPKDIKQALKQLQDAQASVRSLTKDLTNQQVRIMHEEEDQKDSLLLGVLMQRQKAPMSEQMEVLNSDEFAKLPVVAAVLAAKDNKTPLFQQVAAWLDKHSPPSEAPKDNVPALPAKINAGKDGKPDMTPIVNALEARYKNMEINEQHLEELHKKEVQNYDKVMKEKSNNTHLVSRIKSMKKRSERQYLKQIALSKHDMKTFRSAIEAVKKGDVKALTAAQDALKASMRAAEAQSGKFLVLIQMVHRSEGLDCPYCAAQCVDKCHTAGKSYTTCLTECADAGKA